MKVYRFEQRIYIELLENILMFSFKMIFYPINLEYADKSKYAENKKHTPKSFRGIF